MIFRFNDRLRFNLRLDDFRFSNEFGFSLYDSANVVCEKSEVKRKLSAGRNLLLAGRNLLLAGCGSDPHKFIQEIRLSRAGNLEVLSIAHDHLSSISPDILFDLFQVDE